MTEDSGRPKRIQRQRTKGWKMPEGAVYVGRPSTWGNPFNVESKWVFWAGVALGFRGDRTGRARAAVHLYRGWMTRKVPEPMPRADDAPFGGAIAYGDGREVPTSEHVQGFAGSVAALTDPPVLPARPPLDVLRGKDLACWCPLDQPCHADVLLELANRSHVP